MSGTLYSIPLPYLSTLGARYLAPRQRKGTGAGVMGRQGGTPGTHPARGWREGSIPNPEFLHISEVQHILYLELFELLQPGFPEGGVEGPVPDGLWFLGSGPRF